MDGCPESWGANFVCFWKTPKCWNYDITNKKDETTSYVVVITETLVKTRDIYINWWWWCMLCYGVVNSHQLWTSQHHVRGRNRHFEKYCKFMMFRQSLTKILRKIDSEALLMRIMLIYLPAALKSMWKWTKNIRYVISIWLKDI